MYTTQKRINKLTNQYIGGPIIGVIGLILILSKLFNNNGIFESVENLVYGLILLASGIYQFISSNKKIELVKGQKFEVSESGIEIHNFEQIEKIPVTEILTISKKINTLEITRRDNTDIKVINLEYYLLSFEESKQLDEKISNLISRIQK